MAITGRPKTLTSKPSKTGRAVVLSDEVKALVDQVAVIVEKKVGVRLHIGQLLAIVLLHYLKTNERESK